MMLHDFLGLSAILSTMINLLYSYHERVENFFWNWPAYGLIAFSLFLNKAYATSLMILVQAVIATHGFFIWTQNRQIPWHKRLLCFIYDAEHKTQKDVSIQISTMTLWSHVYSFCGIFVSFTLAYTYLQTGDDVSPFMDASSFALFSVATVLLNFKKIESWLYYILADLYTCALSYQTGDWYNIISLVLFIGLDAIIFRRWLILLAERRTQGNFGFKSIL